MTGTNEILRGRAITPLWIVALFVSLTEVILGAAVTQTQDGIQIALTIFVLAFPILIACGFFLVLWFKPYVFYPPAEFGSQINVIDYVRAMRGQSNAENQMQEIRESLRTALLSDDIIADILAATKVGNEIDANKKVGHILDSASDAAIKIVEKKSFITIDTRPLLNENGRVWKELYDPNVAVNSFTDLLYFEMRPDIPPFTYGQRWIIKDKTSGYVFTNLGYPNVAQDIVLSDIGISAGMVLEIVSPKSVKAK